MELNKPSVTALIAAFYRGYHHAHGNPKIFEDPYALRLLTSSARQSIETILIDALSKLDPEVVKSCPDRATMIGQVMRLGAASAIILARARHTEEKLSEAIRRGVRQYVLIGAGLDTFAFRRPELQGVVQVFELDHPATQGFKRKRLSEIGLELPPNLHFASGDFERESVASLLSRVPYQAESPAFFAWPGVTMYLTHNAIHETLRSIKSVAAPGGELVFDYLDQDAFSPKKVSPRLQPMMDAARRQGEPMITGFDPQDLRTTLSRVGFRLVEDLNTEEQQRRFFQNRGDGFRATEHVHFVCARIA